MGGWCLALAGNMATLGHTGRITEPDDPRPFKQPFKQQSRLPVPHLSPFIGVPKSIRVRVWESAVNSRSILIAVTCFLRIVGFGSLR